MNQEMNLNEAVNYLIDKAKAGDIDLEVLAIENKNFKSSFQKQKLDQFDFSTTRKIGLRVLKNGHEGLAYTERFSREILDHTLEEAKGNATLISSDYEVELLGSSQYEPMNELFNTSLTHVSVEEKLAGAKAMEKAALDKDSKVQALPYNGFSDFEVSYRLCNTKGVDATYKKNGCAAFANALVKDGDDAGMGVDLKVSRNFSDIDFEHVGRRAAERALRRLGAKQPKSGKYPVVLENKAAQSLIGMISSYFSAKNIHEHLSPLKGKIKTKVFSDKITIVDDPFYKEGWGSQPFDAEGSPSKLTPLVKNGVIENWLSNSVLAKKMNIENTANATRSPESSLSIGPTNMIIQKGDSSMEDLVRAHAEIIKITNIKGAAGFNAVSGDFSLEAEGEFYKNGEYAGALKNFVLSGNAIEALAKVEAVGNDLYISPSSVICPSLLVSELSIAGQ